MGSRILTAKAGYYDKEQAFVTEFDALEAQKQELQQQIQREQDEATRKFTLKVTPLQERIAGIEDAQKKLHAAFLAWSQEQRARIVVLGEATDGNDRD